ncbi:uncharacterized protein [Ranitomeya imitator]|uniref:uncharacterized protein isoform X1 n=1 Tax=Ranitomeya imitator TaxID=111125 RepID=UPI0037E757FE
MNGLDKFELTKDLYLFCRQLMFKILYHQPSLIDDLPDQDRQTFRDLLDLLTENESAQGRKRFGGRLPSQATPKFTLCPAVQVFFETTCHDIRGLQLDKNTQNNLTKEEKVALSNLKKNDTLEIKEADKGGNIVLWPKDMYCMEARRQLDNTQYYLKLPSDPTLIFKTQFDRLLERAFSCGIINKRERDFLTTAHPVTPTFYLVPKIHKSISVPPGRPIISGLGGLYEKPCSYLDYFLQPLVKTLDSHVRDSSHLIELFQPLLVPDNVILVTLDVEALYTNIEHKQVDFLDLRVSMDQNRIVTTLFRKQTATNNLLHFESFHPSHLRRGIPKGQFLRLRRNCTRTEDFCMEARQLTNRFRERGYPKKIISGAFEFSRTRTREEALQPRVRTETNKINLITKFNNQWNDIYHILKKNWGILRSEPKLRPFIGDRPQMVARRARNLKDHLTNSHFRRPTTKIETSHSIKGSFPCGSCSICPRMIAGEGVRVHNLPTRVQSRTYFNCRTRNLIYALICSCEKIYVGQTTQELRRRTQQHLSSIATARTDRSRGKIITSVAKHFLEVHAGSGASLRVMGLEKVNTSIRGRDPVEDLLCREARWIYELDCLVPQGLNEELLYSGFYKRK